MLEIMLAFVFLVLVIAGMAIGVIMGKKPLKGSCGGVAAALGEDNYTCDICGGDPNKCDEQSDSNDNNGLPPSQQGLAYDASGNNK